MKTKKNKTKSSKRKVLALIDGNALVHRAYHALPPLTTKDGKPSGAVYGFALTLFGMIDQVKPDYIIAAFDVKGPTFRHKEFKEYKANRKKAPDDLYEQIPMCQDLLKAYGVPVYTKKGFEADDILGTISKKPEIEKTLHTLIVTGDMDLSQLVDKDTSIFTLRRGVKDTVIYDEKGVFEKYKIRPDQVVDYKALRGDPSDNIPGVKGVGDKTAVDLLQKFEHLDTIYKNLDKIEKPAVKKKLEDNEKEAFLSYNLATIATDVDVEVDLGEAQVVNFSKDGLGKYLQEMGFQTLYKRVIGSDIPAENEQRKNGREAFDFVELKDKKDIKKVISKIEKKKQFSYALDIEGNKFYTAKIKGIGIHLGDKRGKGFASKRPGATAKGRGRQNLEERDENKVYYVPSDFWLDFQEPFSNPKIRKNGYDIKLDLELLTARQDLTVGDNFFDAKLAGYLLGQGKKSDLEKDIFTEFGESFQYDEKQGNQASLLSGLDENKKKLLAEKAGWVTRLMEFYEDKLISKEKGLGKVFSELEMPLIAVLAKMEINGVKVDQKVLNDLSDFLGKKLATLEKEIYKLTGEEFNINSPGQLAEVLFEKMKLPTKGIKKGKTNYSTAAEQLEKLREIDPVIKFIEEYRTFAKLKNTYADPLPELIQKDKRIHTSFNQVGAITGRLSSVEPNLQNIPKYGEVSKLIRQSFIADEGKILVSADYSQIDLRVAAHLSEDPKMMQIFNDGKDIHKSTAAWVNGIELDEVTKEQRSESKSLNFGVLYGMGTYGFMRDSGVSQERAEFFIAQYMKTFSKLKEFIEKTKEDARKNGFVETEFGRRRYLPNINASNYMVRGGAERAAINFPIQGLAADIMKLAMLDVDTLIEDGSGAERGKGFASKRTVATAEGRERQNLEERGQSNQSNKIVTTHPKLELQIHDELIIEIDKDKAENFSQELKKIMENVYRLKVPLTVETSTGKNWGEL